MTGLCTRAACAISKDSTFVDVPLLCTVHLEVELAVLIVLDWGPFFCCQEVRSGKGKALGS